MKRRTWTLGRIGGIACGMLGAVALGAAARAGTDSGYDCELYCENYDPPQLLTTWKCNQAADCCGIQNCQTLDFDTTCCATPQYACLKFLDPVTGEPHATCVFIP